MLLAPLLPAGSAAAQGWVASWTASVHGPYPSGNPTAQPELKFAFPSPVQGAQPDVSPERVKADVIVAFGGSITDATGTTLNGDDRWPDVLSRRGKAK
jgi:hypothetical protein